MSLISRVGRREGLLPEQKPEDELTDHPDTASDDDVPSIPLVTASLRPNRIDMDFGMTVGIELEDNPG